MSVDRATTPELPALWDMDSADYECDCPGPPPSFRLPPPPRPPFLHPGADCSEAPILDLETCDAVPVIDAEYHSSPALPSLAVIVVCSVLLVAMVLIASVLVWKHKRKMQNFLPCKSSPAVNRCGDPMNGNGVIYEDLTNLRPRTLANHCGPQTQPPSIEMLDVKAGDFHPGFHVLGNPTVFICQPPRGPGPDPYSSQDLYNPVYEELSNGSGDRGDSDPDSEEVHAATHSEDEFAEDELSLGGDVELARRDVDRPRTIEEDVVHSGTSSLQGSTGNDLCRDLDSSDADDRSRFLSGGRNFSLPPGYRTRAPRAPHRTSHGSNTVHPPRPRSLDRRRGWRSKLQQQNSPVTPRHQDCGEFHEGLLLDALLQMYPNVVGNANGNGNGNGRPVLRSANHPPPVPSVAHRLPYILPTVPAPSPPQLPRQQQQQPQYVNPYESVPVLTHLHQHHHHQRPENFSTFRPAVHSQDSSFGSDSGYSNNTSGGRTNPRGRKDNHRLSSLSGDLVLS